MSRERKVFLVVLTVLVVLVAAVLLMPSVSEYTAPRVEAAWVALQPRGAEAAVLGPVELPAGTPFTLHAVIEAHTRGGDAVWYTEAPALVRGGEPVPGEVRRWDRPDEVKVLWFTVEGSQPVLDLRPGESVERFRPLAFLRHDWPFAWSVPGRLQPANDDSFASPGSRVERPFGTQRYQVRVEIVDPRRDEEGLVPKRSFSSLGPDRLLAEVARFPTMIQALPGAAGPASAVFGLTQIRPPEGEGEVEAVTDEEMEAVRSGALSGELVELTRRRVAFATLPLLREVLDAAGVAPGGAPWRYVSLDGSARWGEQVHAGDLLRVGRRVVVLYTDAAGGQGGAPEPAAGNGVLDRDDLVFDYAFGAVVRPLSDVFAGEGGQVEWIPLGGGEA